MGANDAREQLEAAKAECVRLEREMGNWMGKAVAELRAAEIWKARALAAEAALGEIAEVVDVFRDDEWRAVIGAVVAALRSVSLPESKEADR